LYDQSTCSLDRNGQYDPESGFDPAIMKAPAHDVRLMHCCSGKMLGFETETLIDAVKDEAVTAIDNFLGKRSDRDTLMLIIRGMGTIPECQRMIST